MPIPGFALVAPLPPDDPEKVALRAQIEQLQTQLADVTNRFDLFVGRIRAELIERGAVTRAEIQADLDTLTN